MEDNRLYKVYRDASGREICPITKEYVSVHHELHHIVPVQYGGAEDGLLIKISTSGHRLLHLQAEALCAKNPKQRYYLSGKQLDDPDIRDLLRFIIQAKRRQDNIDPNQKRRLVIEINQSMLTKLHKMKADGGYTNLNEYVFDLLNAHIKSKFLD